MGHDMFPAQLLHAAAPQAAPTAASSPPPSKNAALQGEAQLRRLALVGNALPALLPGHLSGLAQLSRLDASRNRLAELAGLAALPRLVELRLARNRLTEAALDHITVRQQAAGAAWQAMAELGSAR